MKIIKGGHEGKFEILAMSLPFKLYEDVDNEMVENPGPENLGQHALSVIEKAGRTCYQSEKKDSETYFTESFIKMLRDKGHHAMLEHSSLTVKFSNVSRGFTHEMVRHRLCNFAQESTRYVDESKYEVVMPPFIEDDIIGGRERYLQKKVLEFVVSGERIVFDLTEVLDIMKQTYMKLQSEHGWRKQDARQFLPIGITNDIVVTANFREWMHIFSLRTAKPAHWEIRAVTIKLLKKLQELIPIIFDDYVIEDDVDSCGIRWTTKNDN